MATKTKTTAKSAGTIMIEQYRSGICCQEKQKRTLLALGFRRLRQRVERPDNAAVRGMVNAILHLVRIVAAEKEAGRGRA